MKKFVQRLGVLRTALLLLTLMATVAMPWADSSLAPAGMGLLRGTVLPAIAPILFMVIVLDLLMCQIAKADEEISLQRRRDLHFISILHVIFAAALLLSWLPVILRAEF